MGFRRASPTVRRFRTQTRPTAISTVSVTPAIRLLMPPTTKGHGAPSTSIRHTRTSIKRSRISNSARASRRLDADGDGEHDRSDRCPEPAPGETVDDSGCSLAQLCATIAGPGVWVDPGRASWLRSAAGPGAPPPRPAGRPVARAAGAQPLLALRRSSPLGPILAGLRDALAAGASCRPRAAP